jgi:hypothetical protein
MKKRQILSAVLASLMALGQFAWPAMAAADEAKPQDKPAATASPKPTASVTPSPAASASPAPKPSVSPTPSPTASASPSPSPSPSPEAAPTKKKSTDVGPDGCGGTVPDWVFDTVSRTWVAADKPSFVCDKASGYFLSTKYYFDKRIGWYEIIPPTAAAVQPAYMITAPNVVHTVLGDLIVGSQDYNVAKALGLLTGGSNGILGTPGSPSTNATINGTGAGSNNQGSVTNGGQTWFDLTNLVNVINTLQSNATSGNVNAKSNTVVGPASTGAASVVANLINLLASAWSWSNGNLSFFMQNILAPQNGDLMLNPTQTTTGGGGNLGVGINGTGSGSNNTVDANNPNNLTVKAQNSGNIVNNVDVNALSGDANATKNTSVGNIASGSATAQINIINLINSFISSGSSFFGVLNILGSLNGDILFPTGFLNGLVPANSVPSSSSANLNNTGAGSNNQVGSNTSNSATANTNSSNGVNNNILTTAGSGSANLNANTSVGNVSTGSANTNQGLFNLNNSSIFGDNAVLVMVNVLGHWVGKIMSLPGTGQSQAALLTGNATVSPSTNATISNTGSNSNNTVNNNNPTTSNIDANSTGSITNNVKVNAQSGNVNANKNTKVGDVTTGDAKAGSSVANIFNTVLNVKHWFGVLVINVFGDWTGDVNHDSAAGGYSTAAGRDEGAALQGASSTPSASSTNLPTAGLLALVAPLTNPTVAATSSNGATNTTNITAGQNKAQVLTAAAQSAPVATAAATQAKNMSFLFILSAIVMLLAGALATIDSRLKR